MTGFIGLFDVHNKLNKSAPDAVMNTDGWVRTALEHNGLLEALCSRNGDEMERRVKRHSALAWEFIERSFAS
jgi:hypothetical protein